MRILALDLGGAWVGSAISDRLGITCRPYQTIARTELIAFLARVIAAEGIEAIVVGEPQTLRGTKSEQTRQIHTVFEKLSTQFSGVQWILWDESLTSQQAEEHQRQCKKKQSIKDRKKESHSIAAAFILQMYLTYKSNKK